MLLAFRVSRSTQLPMSGAGNGTAIVNRTPAERFGPSPSHPTMLGRGAKLLPFALLTLMVVVACAWNLRAGVSWQWPDIGGLLVMLLPCWLVAAYAQFRGVRKLVEVSSFMSVYFIYSFYATRLSYVVSTLDYPFIDSGLESFDASIGFHWGQWQHFVAAHHLVLLLHRFVYPTHFFQIALCVVVFSYLRPGSRNYEMLFLLTLSVIITITVFALYPTFGPAKAAGLSAPHERIIDLLRLGGGRDLPYTGIISFPSFHTVMALTFVYCNRGIKQSFGPILSWNAVMLFTLPYGGDHNIADLLGGAVVATISIGVSRLIYRTQAGWPNRSVLTAGQLAVS